MKVLVTDAEYTALDIEADVLTTAGHQMVTASCRRPGDVIEAARGADALLVQYAPITAEVLSALPQLRLVSRYGVGVDGVDTTAASEHGVWVCNVPDYGTEEVALHAVGMLHLPLTDATRGLIGADLLGRMPTGSYLVNTARGGLVDLDAVVDALEAGQLAGVALDVLPHEPPPKDHPLLTHPRALITPHVAWYSAEAEIELRRKAAQNIVDWARSGRPTYAVVEGR
jgi:phosphoglycerate dehydrogenase-like enzyme